MNRSNCIIIFSLICLLFDCKKDYTIDYRDKVIGDYHGVHINTNWNGNGYNRDTSSIEMSLSKSNLDSIVDLTFNPAIATSPSGDAVFSFKYENSIFISLSDYHPPRLSLSNDTLYFHVQFGLGPNWDDCIAKKK